MRATFFIVLVATLYTVVAAPFEQRMSLALNKRDCDPMPSKVDPEMRDLIYREVRKETKDYKALQITMCTAITESLVNNLYCGDQDSLGLFQMRPSMDWGTPQQINDPIYAVHRFLKAMLPIYHDNPGLPVNVICQKTQNAEAGDLYWRNIDFAAQLIEEARKSVGDDEDQPAPPKTQTTSKPPANNGGAANVAKPTPTSDSPKPAPTESVAPENDGHDDGIDCNDELPPCEQYYTPVSGDYCILVADKFQLTLEQFFKLNPDVDSKCSNLYAGQQYCVAAEDVNA